MDYKNDMEKILKFEQSILEEKLNRSIKNPIEYQQIKHRQREIFESLYELEKDYSSKKYPTKEAIN